MIYILIGEDSLSKEAKLKEIKEEFLSKETKDFNLDILYARELNLNSLQEKILYLPVRVKRRVIIIKEAQVLKKEIKEFILKFAKVSQPQIILVLDIEPGNSLKNKTGFRDPENEFIRYISRYAKILRFKEEPRLDAFLLGRQIEFKKTAYALRILHELLEDGERPERILGGLRYSLEKNLANPPDFGKRIKLLLNCDLDIKTGRLKPHIALERLVVRLCYS